jgi:hypothetical protein
MEIIIKRTENRFTGFLGFLFLLGLGFIPLWLFGGILGWAFFLLFAVLSLLPMASAFKPVTITSFLGTKDGNLVWWTDRQGERIEECCVPGDDIRKVTTWSDRGFVTEIQVVVADGTVLVVPQYLQPAANAKKIISGIKGLSPAIEIEEADAADAADEPANQASGEAYTVRRDTQDSSAKARARRRGNRWTFTAKNAWKYTLVFVVAGVAMVAVAVDWGISTYRFTRNASPASGTIEKIDLAGRFGHRTYRYTVVFTDKSGQVQAFTENGSSHNDFTVGQEIRVVYNANNPSVAHIVGFQFLWLPPVFIGGIGLGMAAIGLVGFFSVLWTRKQYSS